MAKFRINQWELYYKGRRLGKTKNATSRLTVTGKYVTVDDVETVEGIYASLEKGVVPKFQTEFYDTDYDYIWGVLLEGRLDGDSAGSKKNYYLGDNLNNEMEEIGGELLLHPAGVPLSDTSRDIKLFNTAAILNENEWVGDRDNADSFAVEFETYPDETKIGSRRYGVFGNWELDASVAIGVFIQPGERAILPGKTMTDMTLIAEQITRWQGFAVFGDDSGETFLLNGGIADGVTKTFNFDTLSFPSLLKVGSYFKCQNEWFVIESITYATVDSGSITAQRALWNSVGVLHADNTSCAIYEQISFENRTDSGQWAIDDNTYIEVGNTYGATNPNDRKGIILHKNAGAGSGNVTFTFGGQASLNLVANAA